MVGTKGTTMAVEEEVNINKQCALIWSQVLPVALVPEPPRLPGCSCPEKTLLTHFSNVPGETSRTLAEQQNSRVKNGRRILSHTCESGEHAAEQSQFPRGGINRSQRDQARFLSGFFNNYSLSMAD